MLWTVLLHPAFADEFDELTAAVQDELSAYLVYLQQTGPTLRRPHADTLNGSKHGNMKELRFSADGGVWRVAFAFDPERRVSTAVGIQATGAE